MISLETLIIYSALISISLYFFSLGAKLLENAKERIYVKQCEQILKVLEEENKLAKYVEYKNNVRFVTEVKGMGNKIECRGKVYQIDFHITGEGKCLRTNNHSLELYEC